MISHSIRAVTLATLFAVTMFAAGTSALAASFDGPWSVLVVTRSGPCDPSYRYGVTISRGVVSYAGGGPVSLTGRVSPCRAARNTRSARVGFRAAPAVAAGAAKAPTEPAPAYGARVGVERARRKTHRSFPRKRESKLDPAFTRTSGP